MNVLALQLFGLLVTPYGRKGPISSCTESNTWAGQHPEIVLDSDLLSSGFSWRGALLQPPMPTAWLPTALTMAVTIAASGGDLLLKLCLGAFGLGNLDCIGNACIFGLSA